MSGVPVPDRGARRVYAIVAWVSLATVVAVGLYGLYESLTGHFAVVGEQLVGVYWPIPHLFAQPITYFTVACVALFYSGFRLWDARLRTWPRWTLTLIQVFGFVVAFSAAYEVLYNFMLWGATYSVACTSAVTCDPDMFFTSYPVPWNLVFATRVFSAIFVVSGYTVYYLRRMTGSFAL